MQQPYQGAAKAGDQDNSGKEVNKGHTFSWTHGWYEHAALDEGDRLGLG